MKIVLLPEAELELNEAKTYYGSENIEIAGVFVQEVDRVLRQIAQFPHSGPRRFIILRRCGMNRFPYGIFYRVFSDHILVVSISHASRRPGYWRRRVTR
jgi:toxin ParE1/3/4